MAHSMILRISSKFCFATSIFVLLKNSFLSVECYPTPFASTPSLRKLRSISINSHIPSARSVGRFGEKSINYVQEEYPSSPLYLHSQHDVRSRIKKKNTKVQQNKTISKVPSNVGRKVVRILPTFLIMLCSSFIGAQNANALNTLCSNQRHGIKLLLKYVSFVFLTLSILNQCYLLTQTKKRQKHDPTSEWGRYADYPSARGRALMNLFLKMSTYMIASKMVLLPGLRQKDEKIKTERSRNLIKRAGTTFANGLLKLGPLYIKIGQILSCRENLLPKEWITALEKLQDRVPGKEGDEARALAYEAFGSKDQFNEVLCNFDDKPIAAASLGQVHKARLRSDPAKEVVIKLQRSRLRDIYDKDLALLKKIATFGDKIANINKNSESVKQNWTEIFLQAQDVLYDEIDYTIEAKNAIRFAQNFGLGLDGTSETPKGVSSYEGAQIESAASWLRTPYVYEDLSTEKLLVMEYVPSIKVNNNTLLDLANVTMEQRTFLANSLARSYLYQFCVHKFFSTDPHAGNLGIEVIDGDNAGVRLVVYDLGQACSLGNGQSAGILNVIEGIVDSDAAKCVEAFNEMGVLIEGANLDLVQKKVQNNFDTGKIKVKKKISPNESGLTNLTNCTDPMQIEEVRDKDVMPYFTLPAQYAFVARAISQLDGVGKSLDPEFDFISASAPHIVEIKGVKAYMVDQVKRYISNIEKKQNDFFKSLGLFK